MARIQLFTMCTILGLFMSPPASALTSSADQLNCSAQAALTSADAGPSLLINSGSYQGPSYAPMPLPSAALPPVEKPTLLSASVNPLARLGGLWSLVLLVFVGMLLHPVSGEMLRSRWLHVRRLPSRGVTSSADLEVDFFSDLGLDLFPSPAANHAPLLSQLEEVPQRDVLFASPQMAALVEHVANDHAFLEVVAEEPVRSAPSRRAFRSPESLRESVIYRNRRWPGRAVELVPLLIALVPMLAVVAPALFGFDVAFAAGENDAALKLELGGAGAEGSATAVKLLVVLTMLAVAPAVVLSMTSFTRMIVVFSLTRQALGIQQAPPNQILVGLALFLTWYVMAPTFDQVNEVAVQPYQAGTMTEADAVEAAMVPMKKFMLRNTRENDLGLFMRLSKIERPKTRADVPARVLVPAFIISELKTAFQIGFLIYVPFLIIDIVVSVVLLAMGMMVLPPVVISLPFKLLLFVFVDGWNLLVGSMVESFV